MRRAAAGHRGRVLRRPPHPRAATRVAVGDAATVRHLPRRMRSDGLETVNVRTSRGTTVPVVLPRTPVGRSGGRLYPALVVLGIYDRWPKLASQAARSPCSARWPKRRRSSAPTIALDIKTLLATRREHGAGGPRDARFPVRLPQPRSSRPSGDRRRSSPCCCRTRGRSVNAADNKCGGSAAPPRRNSPTRSWVSSTEFPTPWLPPTVPYSAPSLRCL